MSNFKNPTTDIGSIVPLNLSARVQPFVTNMTKSESHEERMWSASRAGTPPTKRGAFNGAMPATLPSTPLSLNPLLFVTKAVTNPAMAGSGTQDATPRKRDPASGKFTASPTAGPETTAEDDASEASRHAQLTQRRMGMKSFMDEVSKAFDQNGGGEGGGGPMFNKPKPTMPQQAGVPTGPPGIGSSVDSAMGAAPQQQQMGPQPLGMTPGGAPVFDDPYHPNHAQFSPEDHQAAAALQNQLAEQATNTGQIPTALDHQLKARIHGDLSNDSKSPMERVLSRQGMPGAAQGEGNQMPGADQGMPPNAAASADNANQMPEMNNGGMPPNAAMSADNASQPPMNNGNAPQNDSMDNFLTQLPDAQPGAQNMLNPDQNKPNTGPPDGNQGPLPRMTNTNTDSPIGPQSQSMQHAGTISQPQSMPPSPEDGSSMPAIEGEGQNQFSSTGDSYGFDDDDDLSDDGAEPEMGGDVGASGMGGDEGAADDEGDWTPVGEEDGLPDSNAGTPFSLDDEADDQPTAGGASSSPPMDAGPSTDDTVDDDEASAENGPFTGNPTDELKKETVKSLAFSAWMSSI